MVARALVVVSACLAVMDLGGCAGTTVTAKAPPAAAAPTTPGVDVSEEMTRRGLERHYLSSPAFGAPRGRAFEDLIPTGARITALHVDRGATINAIWMTYELHGREQHTPKRGGGGGPVETLRLDGREKIVGIHGTGQGGLDELVVATNKRVVTFGRSSVARPDAAPPDCARLSTEDKRRFVGIGFVGRADERLRQLSLRLQIRQPE